MMFRTFTDKQLERLAEVGGAPFTQLHTCLFHTLLKLPSACVHMPSNADVQEQPFKCFVQLELVQRHTKPIVHFLIKAPKLIQIYITIL